MSLIIVIYKVEVILKILYHKLLKIGHKDLIREIEGGLIPLSRIKIQGELKYIQLLPGHSVTL